MKLCFVVEYLVGYTLRWLRQIAKDNA